YRGPATFYGGALEGGNCMMKGYQLPPGVSGAAIGGNNWKNSANCGACAEVRGNGKKVIVMFVDQCPECGDGLDFFPDGFKQLADPSVGKFTVEWNFVECPVQGPLKITDKEGTNEYYVAMQAQNGKEPTESLELSSDGGKTYKPAQRDSTNHFILNGGPVGAQLVDVKATSKSGKVSVVKGVPISGG
ncbi:RlpA-like double-psi beta-barrel-protein domain-containing protein-containing protein, partial [Phyllosticta citrichinensis]